MLLLAAAVAWLEQRLDRGLVQGDENIVVDAKE